MSFLLDDNKWVGQSLGEIAENILKAIKWSLCQSSSAFTTRKWIRWFMVKLVLTRQSQSNTCKLQTTPLMYETELFEV